MGNKANTQTRELESFDIPPSFYMPELLDECVLQEEVEIITDNFHSFLNIASKLLLNKIIHGHSSEPSHETSQFSEEKFLRAKCQSIIYTNPMEPLPVFYFSQELLKPQCLIPDPQDIYDFIRPVFQSLNIQYECLIIAYIYVEKLRVALRAENWKCIVLGALIIASKVWEDISVLNLDFAIIYESFPITSINTIEGIFADAIEWDLFIPLEQYTYYYHLLRSISNHI